MAKRTRTFLKGKYETGDKPTETNYSDWIDSFLSLGTSAAEGSNDQLFGKFTITSALDVQGTVTAKEVRVSGTMSARAVKASSASFTGTVSAADISLDSISTSAGTFTGQVSANTLAANLANGSVVYSSAGVLAEDNGNFYWDAANARLGIGIAASENTLVVASATLGTTLGVHASGGTDLAEFAVHRHSDTAAFGSHFIGVRSRGTEAAEAQVTAEDVLLRLDGVGHDGTDYAVAAQIDMEVDATIAANNVPGRIIFKTASAGQGAAVETMRLDNSGKLSVKGAVSAFDIFATDRVSAQYFRGGPFCGFYVTNASATNIVSASVFQPLNGQVKDFGSGNGFVLTSASGKITYATPVTADLFIEYNISFTGQNNAIYETGLSKNGVLVSGSQQQRKVGTGTDIGAMSGAAIITGVVSGDVIRPVISSDTVGNMTAQRFSIVLEEV